MTAEAAWWVFTGLLPILIGVLLFGAMVGAFFREGGDD